MTVSGSTTGDQRFTIRRLSPRTEVRDEMAADVRAGLTATPKELPPKYFYDGRGSELFEQITRLPEYYPTRAETEILEAHAGDLIDRARPSELLELGSGSSRKTRLLLEAMHASRSGWRYVPLDVSEDALVAAAEALTADEPWLTVEGLVGDFHTDLGLVPPAGRRLLAFLGSTVGNLDPAERASFFDSIAGLLGDDDHFLVGIDLVKDAGTLEAAYDDASGVTAEFNRNVLHVLNRELGADFQVDAFSHVAVFDKEEAWVEMRLRAERDMVVSFPGLDMQVEFRAGEEMRTEISCKFTREGFEAELSAAGLAVSSWLTDDGDRFALTLARRA